MPRLHRRELLRGAAAALAGAAASACAGVGGRTALPFGPGAGGPPEAGAPGPPVPDGLAPLDGLAQAELVRRGEATPSELVEAAIRRIERVDPRLGAVVTPTFERARERVRSDSLAEGPFHGVPFLVKDLSETAGVRTTYGSRLFRELVPEATHPVIRRMEATGLVSLGKTNTPELGLLPTTEPLLFGPTRNPWAPERSAGGSSGGAAAAVAAGLVPLAQGSDGGGSIRIPACNCGVFGLKPSRARYAAGGEAPVDLSVRHVLTRSVRDSAAMLRAAHRSVAEGSALPPPVAPRGARLRRLRIARATTDLYGRPLHPECRAAVERAAALCERLGHRVEEASPEVEGEAFREHFLAVWSSLPVEVVESARERTGKAPPEDALEPATWGMVELYRREVGEAGLERSVAWLHALEQRLAGFTAAYDLWLSPVLARPAARLGEMAPDLPFERLLPRVVDYAAFTPLANVLGAPAMSVPLHWTPEGVPVGVQLMGRVGEDATLLLLAEELEAERPWAGRWPAAIA